ncbi:MAG: type VI secretion system tip protein VgrG [Gammaproteobacteria bacterium]|nr:type VI secretion system tip protein VgrG [Gammaproteobacteria bacterium]
MPESPMVNSSAVVKLSIFSNGTQIDDAINVASVNVTSTINKIPQAKIVLIDGDMQNKDFPLSNSDDFKPGREIEINAGYGQDEDTIFKGIVVKHGIKISGDNNSRLVIECRDKAVAMTIGRHNANFVESKDSDIISGLVSAYSGLDSEVDATTTQHPELVQYYCSDWDFLLARAEVNGLLVSIEDAKLSVKAPQTSGAVELKLTYGQDLIEFHADIDARSQFAEVNAVSWDPDSQAVIEEQVTPQDLNKQGDLTSKLLAGVVDLKSFRMQTPAMVEKTALKDWAKGQQLKSGLARIRGRMRFQGSALARIGSLIEVDGVGDHFNGSVFVSSVNHHITQGNWFSDVEFGMSPNWFAEQPDLVIPPASGLLPGVEGLHIGVVMKLDEDPNGQHRVQVQVPMLQAETEGVWARLLNFYASSGCGAFFIPEIGDEVILGYLNNDPTSPVVLGSVYSSNHQPPDTLSADNFIKAIVTRSELRVEFDDDNKIITLNTPAGARIVISDQDFSVRLEDQNGNEVELGPDGISLDSPGDISLSARGKISITAMDELSLHSDADVKLEGLNVNHTANASFSAKGNASAELSASGQTTVKGAMVMIN